jgi:hypothetical protein
MEQVPQQPPCHVLPFLPRQPGASAHRRRPPPPPSADDAAQGLDDLRFVDKYPSLTVILERSTNPRTLPSPNSQIRASSGASGSAILTRPRQSPPLRPRWTTAPTSRTTKTMRQPSWLTAPTLPPQQAPRGPMTRRSTSARWRCCPRSRSSRPSPPPSAAWSTGRTRPSSPCSTPSDLLISKTAPLQQWRRR